MSFFFFGHLRAAEQAENTTLTYHSAQSANNVFPLALWLRCPKLIDDFIFQLFDAEQTV